MSSSSGQGEALCFVSLQTSQTRTGRKQWPHGRTRVRTGHAVGMPHPDLRGKGRLPGGSDTSCETAQVHAVARPISQPLPHNTRLQTQLLLPGGIGFHAPDLQGEGVVKNPPANAGDVGLIPGSGDPLEEGLANHSSILNPVDRGAWWAAVHRVRHDRRDLARMQHHLRSPASGLARLGPEPSLQG